MRQRFCIELLVLGVVSCSYIELRLEDDRCILRKLMLKTHSYTMSLRKGIVGSECPVVKVFIFKICSLVGFLDDILVRTVVKIITRKVHISVKQSKGTIDTAHPCGRDTVVATETALSTSHAAASATHISHHASGDIVETAVIGIVSIEDDAELALVRKTAYHGGTLITPVIHIRSGTRHIVSAAAHDISEPALGHTWTQLEVNDCLLLTIIDTCKHGLIRLLLYHLYFLDDLCRNIL